MGVLRKIGILLGWLLLIVSTAVVTAAVKQRSQDGPNRVFAGGPLISGVEDLAQLLRGCFVLSKLVGMKQTNVYQLV